MDKRCYNLTEWSALIVILITVGESKILPHSDSVTSPFLSMGEIFYRSPVALQNFYLMLSTYLQILSDSQPPLPTLDDFAQRINQEHKQCLDSPQTSLIHGRNAGEWLLLRSNSILPGTLASLVSGTFHLFPTNCHHVYANCQENAGGKSRYFFLNN